MSSPYDDIIHLPRPSSARPRMSMTERAAQFISICESMKKNHSA